MAIDQPHRVMKQAQKRLRRPQPLSEAWRTSDRALQQLEATTGCSARARKALIDSILAGKLRVFCERLQKVQLSTTSWGDDNYSADRAACEGIATLESAPPRAGMIELTCHLWEQSLDLYTDALDWDWEKGLFKVGPLEAAWLEESVYWLIHKPAFSTLEIEALGSIASGSTDQNGAHTANAADNPGGAKQTPKWRYWTTELVIYFLKRRGADWGSAEDIRKYVREELRHRRPGQKFDSASANPVIEYVLEEVKKRIQKPRNS